MPRPRLARTGPHFCTLVLGRRDPFAYVGAQLWEASADASEGASTLLPTGQGVGRDEGGQRSGYGIPLPTTIGISWCETVKFWAKSMLIWCPLFLRRKDLGKIRDRVSFKGSISSRMQRKVNVWYVYAHYHGLSWYKAMYFMHAHQTSKCPWETQLLHLYVHKTSQTNCQKIVYNQIPSIRSTCVNTCNSSYS